MNRDVTLVLHRPFCISIYSSSHISKFSNSLTQLTTNNYAKQCVKLLAVNTLYEELVARHNTVSVAGWQAPLTKNPPLYVSPCSVYESLDVYVRRIESQLRLKDESLLTDWLANLKV